MSSSSGDAVTSARPGRWRGAGLVLPLVIFLLLMLVLPMIRMLIMSFRPVDEYGQAEPGFTAGQYRRVFAESFFSQALVHSVLVALVVTALCLVLGYPAAYVLAHRRPGVVRTLLLLIVVSPLLTSVVVRSYGWSILLSGNGLVNRILAGSGLRSQPAHLLGSTLAVVVSVTHVLLPFAIIPLTTALRGIEPNLTRASLSLGAGPVRTFWRVTVPLSLPGIAAGVLIVFALSMGIYITPRLIGGTNQPLAGIRIYDQVSSVYDYPMAAALSFVLLVLTGVCTALFGGGLRWWARRLHG
ncbi:ABC transporter permease [Nocardia aurantia]|uniref:Spermidine/putrescine transport system permease protein PotB n=1 Tax=Nocardia aurantia TaxID=2585199 RepID=A0A7K0DRC3_9NOCA|nr:ABC transporter permease [Nocardia aurantia]MQY28148.1 Spermidine/putrescine transport system permease protein PotB [Nocardia aurantia]